MYQPPQQPQQDYSQWQQPNTQYPPQQQWQQPPLPPPPQRYIRQKYKTAAIVCLIVGLTIASAQIPALTVLAALLVLAGVVLVFLI